MQTNKGPNLIVDLSFNFALAAIGYVESLQDCRQFVIANQLARCSTAIGANVREAQNAESKIDFVHKMKIAGKEADETEYWLMLCDKLPQCPPPGQLLEDCKTISKVLSKIIATSKRGA